MELPKILIVDDRHYDRLLYQELLGDTNFVYEELDSGINIIETLNQFHANIILLDWQMPNVNGLETLKIIKKHPVFKSIPTIIITGLEDEKVLEEAFDYGSIDFINKPVSKIELNSRVFSALKLNEAIETTLSQKQELVTLNQIISKQNKELEKVLQLKTKKHEEDKINFKNNLEQKNRQVISKEIDVTRVINHIKNIKSEISTCYDLLKNEHPDSPVLKKILNLQRYVRSLEGNDGFIDEFKTAYESVDPDFSKKLLGINNRLTPLDIRHCSFIRMNLENYEVAQILNVELKSLQMSRYRLKKKLGLDEKTQLRAWLQKI